MHTVVPATQDEGWLLPAITELGGRQEVHERGENPSAPMGVRSVLMTSRHELR